MSNRLISKPAVFGEIEKLLDTGEEVFLQETKEGLILPEQKQREQKQRRKTIYEQKKEQKQNTFINNALRKKDFQSILNKVIDRRTKLKLTQAQANRFYNAVIAAGRYTLNIKGRRLNKEVAFNAASMDFIISILQNGAIVKSVETFDSDTLEEIEVGDIKKLTLKKYEPSRRIENRDASFFPYLNTSRVDLIRYQIYTQEQAEQITKREHCLIETLKLQGVSDDMINQIKLAFVSGVNIKKSDLPIVANIINRNINLHFINGSKVDKKKIKSQDAKFDDVHIAIHSNHYFVFEKTNYSTCYQKL